MLDKSLIKVIAFDCFGTVFDVSKVPHEEMKGYVNHVRKPEWEPLTFPISWENLVAHPDSSFGIDKLRENYIVVTCSNAPLGFMAKLSKRNGINWDAIIPLELNKVYKPNSKAYLTVCEVMGVKPENILMVTANENAGDLEASRALGMQAILIRGNSEVKDIIALSEIL